MPSPISRMTFLAPETLTASRMALLWSPSNRRAPPLTARSPVAARVTVSPAAAFSVSLPLQAASGSTATAPTTTATLRYVLFDN
jgi:hypothetical protein